MCEDYYWRMSGFYPEYYTEYYPALKLYLFSQ